MDGSSGSGKNGASRRIRSICLLDVALLRRGASRPEGEIVGVDAVGVPRQAMRSAAFGCSGIITQRQHDAALKFGDSWRRWASLAGVAPHILTQRALRAGRISARRHGGKPRRRIWRRRASSVSADGPIRDMAPCRNAGHGRRIPAADGGKTRFGRRHCGSCEPLEPLADFGSLPKGRDD